MRLIQAVALWLLCIPGLYAQITVVPTVKHLTSTSTPSAGAITLSVSGGSSPYSYTWTPGPIYTKDISNKVKNAYVVKVKDNASATVTYTYNIAYKADWDQMYGCVSRNDSLIGNASRVCAQAVTKNNLAASTSGFVEYILNGMNETKAFGVLDSLSPWPNMYADIDYGYYYDGSSNALYEIQYGNLVNPVVGYTQGTALRVERSGSTIKFVVNGVTTHSLSDASAAAKVWKVKGLLYNTTSSNSLVNMGCSFATKGSVTFKNYSNLVPFIAHSSGSGATDGFIRMKPLLSGTYTYTWQPGSVASATLSSKAAGTYSLSAKDATSTITPKTYNIGYQVKWDQPYACKIQHDTLITDNNYSWGSAISKNTLPGGTNGWFEYVLRDMNQFRIVGFSSGLSLNPQDIYDIDYGFYYESGNLYSFGKTGYFVPIFSQALEGTVLRVERRGDTIEYKINGSRYSYAVDAVSAAKDWKVKGTVYGAYQSSLVNVGCSFYGQGNSNFPNYNRLTPYITHATSAGTTDGGLSVTPVQSGSYTYTYTWQPGSTSGSSISSKAAGNYTLTVKDALNNSNTLDYNVGYKVQWDLMNGAERRHDTLIYQSPVGISWGTAVSKNTLVGGNDGWLEYVLRNTNQTIEFGFLDSLSADPENIYDIDYGFYYQASSHRLSVTTNAININVGAINPPVGSVLRIERVGNDIRLWMNKTLLATYTDPAAAQKNWKIKGLVYSGDNASLINVGCSFYDQGYVYFPNYNRMKPEIVHSSSPGSNDGSIRVSPRQAGSYSYVWNPGGTDGTTLSSRPAGNYSLTVEDALHHSNTLTYHVGYKTYWDSLQGVKVHGDTLVSNAQYALGRAASKNLLTAGTDGWLEYVIKDSAEVKFIGFLDSLSVVPNQYGDIDYGFYMQGNANLYLVVKGYFYFCKQYRNGMLLRVERVGNTISLFVDGISVYSVTDPVDSHKNWRIKGMLGYNTTMFTFVNVGCSFPVFNMSFTQQDLNCIPNENGKLMIAASGGIPPYSYALNQGAFTSVSTFTNLAAGTYTLNVRDDTGIQLSQVAEILRCPKWLTPFSGVSLSGSGDAVKTASSDSWTNAVLSTGEPFQLKKDTACWVSFETPDTTSVFMLGFRTKMTDSLLYKSDSALVLTNYRLYVNRGTVTVVETDNDGFYNKFEIPGTTVNSGFKVQLSAKGIEYYQRSAPGSPYVLVYISHLFSPAKLIVEHTLYTPGSRTNRIRVSAYGNTN